MEASWQVPEPTTLEVETVTLDGLVAAGQAAPDGADPVSDR